MTLRKLVDQARKAGAAADRRRSGQESAYRFMTAIAGNQPGFEEAIRALFAGRSESFSRHLEAWPEDLRRHAHRLAESAFDADEALP